LFYTALINYSNAVCRKDAGYGILDAG